MSVALLSELREPPVVGRVYMVPTVRYKLGYRVRTWPVIGAIHDDARDLAFPHLHYHLDYRFLTDAMLAVLKARCPAFDIETLVAGVVLSEPTNITSEWSLREYGRLPRRPTLKPRMCRRAEYGFTDRARAEIAKRLGGDKISERFGPIADPIVRADGRLLCPHRKVDLSQFTPDAEGLVTCPLHGLRVKCAARGSKPVRVETGTGSIEDESRARQGLAQTSCEGPSS